MRRISPIISGDAAAYQKASMANGKWRSQYMDLRARARRAPSRAEPMLRRACGFEAGCAHPTTISLYCAECGCA